MCTHLMHLHAASSLPVASVVESYWVVFRSLSEKPQDFVNLIFGFFAFTLAISIHWFNEAYIPVESDEPVPKFPS